MAFNLNNIPSANKTINNDSSIERLLKTEITLFGAGFSNKKKESLYFELAILLKAGVTVKQAITLIAESFKKLTDKELFQNILEGIINGHSLSDALIKSGKFSEYEFYSLKIGEETGTTAKICEQLGQFYQRKNEQSRIVVAALTYPSIVISTALLVVIFMLTYVVPMFQDIFKQNNLELPVLTKIIIKISEFLKSYSLLTLVIILAIALSMRLFKDNYSYKKITSSILLKIPIVGNFITKVYLAQFTQAISLLISSKVPLLNSVQMVKKMINFMPLQQDLEKVEKNILMGSSFSESLKGTRLFDNRIISLVKVAEETNQTDYIFSQLNQQYSQEVIQQSKTMSTILEPFIIVFVGIIVAILLIAMYLPMFQLSSAIG